MPDKTRHLKMVVACHDSNGCPTFVPLKAKATDEDVLFGDHYWTAKDWVTDNGYEEPLVCFDEQDCNAQQVPLLDSFDWDEAPIVDVRKRL